MTMVYTVRFRFRSGFAVIPHGGSLIDGYKSADEQMYANKMKKKKKARLVEKHVD